MPGLLIFVGVLAEALASFAMLERWGWLALIPFVLVAIAVIGAVLVATGSRRTGAYLVIVGSALFVPLGFIAIVGARKVLDADADLAFEARRRAP